MAVFTLDALFQIPHQHNIFFTVTSNSQFLHAYRVNCIALNYNLFFILVYSIFSNFELIQTYKVHTFYNRSRISQNKTTKSELYTSTAPQHPSTAQVITATPQASTRLQQHNTRLQQHITRLQQHSTRLQQHSRRLQQHSAVHSNTALLQHCAVHSNTALLQHSAGHSNTALLQHLLTAPVYSLVGLHGDRSTTWRGLWRGGVFSQCRGFL